MQSREFGRSETAGQRAWSPRQQEHLKKTCDRRNEIRFDFSHGRKMDNV